MDTTTKLNKPMLVGLYAPAAGSGKSEVAKVLNEDFGFAVVKFAGPLKDMARGLLRSMGFDDDTVERMVEGDLKETVVPGFDTVTPRHLMQTLGTDWGREAVDKDLWIKVAVARIQAYLANGISVVVDDLRFPNEFKEITELGGITVHLFRPNHTGNGSSRYEGLLDGYPFDHAIENAGTLDDLHYKTCRFVAVHKISCGRSSEW